jgi:hypothetical protein
MKKLWFVKLLALSCACFAAAEFRSFAAPLITAVAPETGRVGTEVDIFGAGFTDLYRILFTERSSGAHADSLISGLSDSHVLTTVPSRVGSSWLISVFSPLGGTVTIPTGFFDITSETIGVQSSSVYFVRDGGILTGSGASSTVFVESGGSFVGGGAGNLTVYVQQGANYTHGNGGNSLVFYEPGATFSIGGGGGNIFTEIPELQPSFLPVPEPSTVGLFVLGLTFVILLGRSRVPSDRGHTACGIDKT